MLIEAEDYLQDIAFDFYSNKMAVCSSDSRIQVFKRKKINNDNSNHPKDYFTNNELIKAKEENSFYNWELECSWVAHDSPVLKIIFSSPEFGSLLVSSGFDKRVNIWQEKVEGGKPYWISKYKIQEFSDNVEDISFCPRVFGLKLAVCTYNGKIKIFEPKDYVFYVNWTSIHTKDVSLACSSICWNPSLLDPQSFILGCYNKLSNASNIKDVKEGLSEIKKNLLQIYAYDDSKKDFICMTTLYLDDYNSHLDTITSVEWAPQFGRSYHMIGSCSLDKKIIIWKFYFDYDFENDQFKNMRIDPTKICQVLCVENPNPVHRISFNINATVLSTNDSQGLIKIFKKEDGEYKEVFEFKSSLKKNTDF